MPRKVVDTLKHDEDPTELHIPDGHGVQVAEPAYWEKKPEAQGLQVSTLVAPRADEDVPAGHLWHGIWWKMIFWGSLGKNHLVGLAGSVALTEAGNVK